MESSHNGNNVKRIDNWTIDMLCSSQVITNFANVAKELLENAIDANATIVDIKIKEYGKNGIDVCDNGHGIESCDFDNLGRKHCTSKLETMEHLTTIKTFGFRGEALSSICALANVEIHTKHENDSNGNKLILNSDGSIIRKEIVARNTGTTVMVRDLFHTFAPRRKDFINNIKREYDKVIALITEYCVGIIGVRIRCYNWLNDVKYNQLVVNSSGDTLKNNIITVFGLKQMENLVEFQQINYEQFNGTQKFTINGFVSKCDNGSGRSASDRHFYFINNRPCEMKGLTRLINEVYHNFNRNQYPFVVLNIEMDKNDVEINVTPDKRLLMLSKDCEIFDVIKESLMVMYNRNEGCHVTSLPKYDTNTFMKWKCAKRSPQRDDTNDNADEYIPIKLSRCLSPCDSTFRDTQINDNDNDDSGVQFSSLKFIPFESEGSNDEQMTKSFEESTSETIVDKTDKTESKETSNDNAKTVTNTTNVVIDGESDVFQRECINVNADLEIIRNEFKKLCQSSVNEEQNTHFNAKLIPSENKTAEDELSQQLKRDMFNDMKIIGQFNLGFILTKLNDDLFIIDQHASDERKNYENLLSNTVIDSQNLVTPIPLELTAVNELMVIDNIEVFKKHGFGISIDANARSGRKLSLTALPQSKDWIGKIEDVDELINALRESPIQLSPDYKLRQLKSIIANRACRSSVMIGSALTFASMKRIVSKMSELRNPWHCAHHRPTIRHLINLTKM